MTVPRWHGPRHVALAAVGAIADNIGDLIGTSDEFDSDETGAYPVTIAPGLGVTPYDLADNGDVHFRLPLADPARLPYIAVLVAGQTQRDVADDRSALITVTLEVIARFGLSANDEQSRVAVWRSGLTAEWLCQAAMMCVGDSIGAKARELDATNAFGISGAPLITAYPVLDSRGDLDGEESLVFTAVGQIEIKQWLYQPLRTP